MNDVITGIKYTGGLAISGQQASLLSPSASEKATSVQGALTIISAVPTHECSIISGRKISMVSVSCIMAVVLAWFDLQCVLINRNPAI